LYLACSASAYSDDDFTTTAIPSQGCGSGINGFDHQTFGGGKYPEGLFPLAGVVYPHAVYYCAQGQGLVLGGATCSRSDDGGLTFNNPVATWDAECTGIHGHVQVSPSDGTVYLPNAKCGDKQGLAVSKDGGQTWVVRTIPDSLSGESDPYVGVGSDGTVYYSYSDGTGHARVAVSRDHGLTWTKSVDVGVPFGVRNSEFAMVVAGDGDRASVAFLGTTTSGSTQAASFGKNAGGDTFVGGAWHMYLSTTYDRGKTWTTVDSTPKDPVQRGCIWNSGGGNPCRNLLDFNGMTIDKTGRVMVGFADGCVGPATESGNDCVASTAVSANKLVNHGAIIRQLSGKTLFKAYDTVAPVAKPVTPTVPVVPSVPSTPSTGTGSLAATGGAPLAALGGLLLLMAGFAVRRRSARLP
ncbi:MAG: sialidase family protein, partial [Mycobacteriales bacterium]